MTVKYHINSKGVPAICRAQKGKCPFGGSESHFATLEEAQSAADNKNKEDFGILNNVPKEKKELFRVAESEEDKEYIKNRIDKMVEDSKEVRSKTKKFEDGHYIEKCRKSKLIDIIETGEMTEHLEIDRADRMSRINEHFGEGEIVASFEVDHYIKRINGFRFTVQTLTIRDNGRMSMYNKGSNKEITTFHASGSRIEAIFLRAGLIPDQDMIDLATKNHNDDRAMAEGRAPKGRKENTQDDVKPSEETLESTKKAVEAAKNTLGNIKIKRRKGNHVGNQNKGRGGNHKGKSNRGTKKHRSNRGRDKSWKRDYDDYDDYDDYWFRVTLDFLS